MTPMFAIKVPRDLGDVRYTLLPWKNPARTRSTYIQKEACGLVYTWANIFQDTAGWITNQGPQNMLPGGTITFPAVTPEAISHGQR